MAKTLGKVLAEARGKSGLSLREVEAETGISNAHLSQIEKEKIEQPEMSILWDLAALYGLDYEKLLRLAGYASREEPSGRQRQRMTVAMRAMNELSPRKQREAIAFMADLRQGKKGDRGAS